ncbi:MAG: MFS transporter [Oscillospiraceae bacterium]|nr:MFS transporter [Oscillospiraceae bacterium]
MAELNYKATVRACYMSYISHAVIINLPPLLFVLLSNRYGINLERLGRLVLINFVTQLIVDGLAARLADRVGYRRCLLAAHMLAGAGLIAFGLLPQILPPGQIYGGLCAATIVFSIGGGLIEVLVSPVVNRLAGHLGAGSMTLLHSFYCWGQVLTVLFSTIALHWLPEQLWYLLPLCWAVLPFATMGGFAKAPLAEPDATETGVVFKQLLRNRKFWLVFGIMAFAGAAESTMAQWASLFAEWGIGVEKLWGDLLGSCLFALCMAVIRMFYGRFERRFPLRPFLLCGGAACVLCYLTAALSGNPRLALAACALTGVAVSLMWPGTLHRSAEQFPGGGTALFGLLALGGDVGCSVGPWLLGLVAERGKSVSFGTMQNLPALQRGLRLGLLVGAAFPLGFLICMLAGRSPKKKGAVQDA